MLIRFSVENFSSFSDRQVFSLLPGKGTLKSEHKTKKIKGVSILKTSVLFGANASGKSNLIKAIDFGKLLVLKGTKSETKIDFQNFRLDLETVNKDSRIEYEIQHNGKNYAYGFVFNSDIIKEEWLYEIGTNKEVKIFERNFLKIFFRDHSLFRNCYSNILIAFCIFAFSSFKKFGQKSNFFGT